MIYYPSFYISMQNIKDNLWLQLVKIYELDCRDLLYKYFSLQIRLLLYICFILFYNLLKNVILYKERAYFYMMIPTLFFLFLQ